MGRRHLSLQEYQSKQLLADHGVAVQKFRVASTVQEVDNLTKDLRKCSAHRFIRFIILVSKNFLMLHRCALYVEYIMLTIYVGHL